MKCLSVSQPYADLIISGKKTIELRTWSTRFRGNFLIHAPIKTKKDACEKLNIDESMLRTGVIIGRVEIYDVKEYESQKALKADYNKHLFSGNVFKKYGFLLRNPDSLKIPIHYKGSLKLFEAKLGGSPSYNDMKTELFEEEYRYQWVGKH